MKTNRHHRKCRSNHGSGRSRNISVVTEAQHRAWHTLFWNLTPKEIARVITEVWIDPSKQFICVDKEDV